jgi:hypothetical protein
VEDRRKLAVARAEESLDQIVTDPNMVKRMQYAEFMGRAFTFNYYFDVWHKKYERTQKQELKIRILYNLRVFRRWKRVWKQRKRRVRRSKKHQNVLMRLKLKRIIRAWSDDVRNSQRLYGRLKKCGRIAKIIDGDAPFPHNNRNKACSNVLKLPKILLGPLENNTNYVLVANEVFAAGRNKHGTRGENRERSTMASPAPNLRILVETSNTALKEQIVRTFSRMNLQPHQPKPKLMEMPRYKGSLQYDKKTIEALTNRTDVVLTDDVDVYRRASHEYKKNAIFLQDARDTVALPLPGKSVIVHPLADREMYSRLVNVYSQSTKLMADGRKRKLCRVAIVENDPMAANIMKHILKSQFSAENIQHYKSDGLKTLYLDPFSAIDDEWGHLPKSVKTNRRKTLEQMPVHDAYIVSAAVFGGSNDGTTLVEYVSTLVAYGERLPFLLSEGKTTPRQPPAKVFVLSMEEWKPSQVVSVSKRLVQNAGAAAVISDLKYIVQLI